MRGFKLVVDKCSPTCNNEVYYVWQLCIDVEHSQSVCNYILHVLDWSLKTCLSEKIFCLDQC